MPGTEDIGKASSVYVTKEAAKKHAIEAALAKQYGDEGSSGDSGEDLLEEAAAKAAGGGGDGEAGCGSERVARRLCG